MRMALLVAGREYRSVLRTRGFLFATLGVPLLALVMVAVVLGLVNDSLAAPPTLPATTGYVDQANVIGEDGPFRRLESVAAAGAALEASQVDAWFLIAPDYLDTGDIVLHSRHEPGEAPEDAIRDFLRENLARRTESRLPPARLAMPVDLRVQLPGHSLGAQDVAGVFMLQFLYALGFFIAQQTTGGYLIAAVVEEKAGRVLEILVTSISPLQLMSGKILGLGCVGLTQLAVWLGFALTLRALRPDLPGLYAATLPAGYLPVSLVYFLLSYFLAASFLVGIGSISDSEQESRQLAGVLALVAALPFIAYAALLGEPDGALAVGLTLFPLTAPLTAIIRMAMGALPAWQLALSLALLLLSLVVAVPLAARVFRWSLLLHGARPTPARLWHMLRNPAQGRGPA